MDKFLAIFWHNANYYDEGGLTVWGILAVAAICAFIIMKIIVYFVRQAIEYDEEVNKKLKLLKYEDRDDIEVFLSGIGAKMGDFLKSPGLQKQYELFRDGKTSDWQRKAKSLKNAAEDDFLDISAGAGVAGII